MKGKLSKFQDKWGVIYDIPNPPIATATVGWLPLHPEYTKYYFLDEDAEGGEVEWDWCVIVDHDSGKGKEYAKLVRSENKIDLQKLETKLDQSLSEETDWTLSKWLKEKREQTNGERFDEFMDTIKSNENFKQYSTYEHKETVTSSDTPTYGKGELVYKDGTPIRSYYSAKIQALLDEVVAEEATRPFTLFIDDIDTELALIEDYAKGEVGEAITKLRKKIAHFYTTLK